MPSASLRAQRQQAHLFRWSQLIRRPPRIEPVMNPVTVAAGRSTVNTATNRRAGADIMNRVATRVIDLFHCYSYGDCTSELRALVGGKRTQLQMPIVVADAKLSTRHTSYSQGYSSCKEGQTKPTRGLCEDQPLHIITPHKRVGTPCLKFEMYDARQRALGERTL